ncbi:MAG: 4-(cytidine 5'-diphospho)-2-C-methyl-D-erythritol kinase [Bacteroidales bacterium]|nr:4-(cytidine 5'-diphospho)-2-C-methyl-D-erythritol kinase [Bacteroidales bacterium]
MLLFPNAKINLGLHVVKKRPDGFHNIETLFYPIPLCDVLEIIQADQEDIEFTSSGLPIPGDAGSNLVMKAVNLMSDAGCRMPDAPLPLWGGVGGGVTAGIRIHLHKLIPMGAGLGGGSSDGAHTIKLLNDLWKLGWTVSQMQEVARQLGSDCAFFIENVPVLAAGRGDQFEPVDLDLSGYQIVVVIPPVPVSTQEAYAMITPRKPERSLKEAIRLPVERWKEILINDFEEPVMKKHPVIREMKEELYRQGAIYASMSGSGAAVYGIFSPQSSVLSLQFDPSLKVFYC